ncbi:amino acid ABC transporter substrate-binding protein [Kiloniella laminariae]|uniref:Amino acid ABC transporter substrate-binding protein n=1 Tax=Kiloniella laminariae TaxID=454162 RepID=A0ABT4LP38_9PROT|nr:amino acid ABC transporter substrate-binding protein [Kiloniella laminariae]MCZ4282660.1 amino acid ABC transporter substrate-binding protein [Kiloniella laminariae]
MKFGKVLFAAAAATAMSTAAQAGTLDDVKAKGFLQCGVATPLPGFAAPNAQNEWEGLDVDVCRAVGAAVFGDASKVKYTPTTSKERFTVLQAGEVDMLSRNTTWTFSRDVNLGFEFTGVNYYDGQGFMVNKSLGVSSATELDGASVCVQTGTTTELNLADYFRSKGMSYETVPVATAEEGAKVYDEGRCDVYTTDASGLYSLRSTLSAPADQIVLPEIISKEPLGPLVRHGDQQWGDISRWSLNAMIIAEELGVTSANVDEMLSSENPEILRLLGAEGNMGEQLGLDAKWAYNIVKQVGNYGESFKRNLTDSLNIERGINAQWKDGGLLYAPPMR